MDIPGGNESEVDNFIFHIITMNWFTGRNPCDMYWPCINCKTSKNDHFNPAKSPLLDCEVLFHH